MNINFNRITMIRKYIMIASALLCGSIFTACDDDNDTPTFPEKTETTYDMSGFARGADVSWLSEMESSGYKFYTSDGKEQECMSLLRDLGINAIRLRVWVNPENDTEDVKGWCNKGDVLLKAWRAHNLGYRLMIDFHYSDRWADPVQQAKPKAWENYTVEELEQAIADHTKDVLGAIKEMGIDVEWVQVGNETHQGMLCIRAYIYCRIINFLHTYHNVFLYSLYNFSCERNGTLFSSRSFSRFSPVPSTILPFAVSRNP